MTDGSPLTRPSLRAKRSNPGAAVRPSGLRSACGVCCGPWIASSQGLLAMTDGSPLTHPSSRAKRSNPGAAARPCGSPRMLWPWIASSQGLLAMSDRSPLTRPSLRAKRSNPAAAVRPSGLLTLRMFWPLDCFVARAPRNDGWVAADPSVIASEAKQSSGGSTTVWVTPRMLWPWIASSQGLLAMTDGSPLTHPSLRAKRSKSQGLQYDRLGCWRRACCGPWIASSQGLLAMTDRSPLTHPSLRAKRSNPGAAGRPYGLLTPRMLWPWIASSQGLLAMTDGSPLTRPSLRAKRSKSQGLQYDRLGCWRRACCGPWIASSQCRKDERAAAIFPATLPLALAIQPCRSDRPPYSRRPPISLSRNPADIRATYA